MRTSLVRKFCASYFYLVNISLCEAKSSLRSHYPLQGTRAYCSFQLFDLLRFDCPMKGVSMRSQKAQTARAAYAFKTLQGFSRRRYQYAPFGLLKSKILKATNFFILTAKRLHGNPKGYHASAPYPLKYFSYRKKKQ